MNSKKTPGLSSRLVSKLQRDEIWATLMIRDHSTFSIDIDNDVAGVYDDDDKYVVKFTKKSPTNACVVFCFPNEGTGNVIIGRVDPLSPLSAYKNTHKLQCALNANHDASSPTFAMLYHDNIYMISGVNPRKHNIYLMWAEEVRRVTPMQLDVYFMGTTPLLVVTNRYYGIRAIFPIWPGVDDCDQRIPPKLLPIRNPEQMELALPTMSNWLTLDQPPKVKPRLDSKAHMSESQVNTLIYSETKTEKEEEYYSAPDLSSYSLDGSIYDDHSQLGTGNEDEEDEDEDDLALSAWLNGRGVPSASTSTEVSFEDTTPAPTTSNDDGNILQLVRGDILSRELSVSPRYPNTNSPGRRRRSPAGGGKKRSTPRMRLGGDR